MGMGEEGWLWMGPGSYCLISASCTGWHPGWLIGTTTNHVALACFSALEFGRFSAWTDSKVLSSHRLSHPDQPPPQTLSYTLLQFHHGQSLVYHSLRLRRLFALSTDICLSRSAIISSPNNREAGVLFTIGGQRLDEKQRDANPPLQSRGRA